MYESTPQPFWNDDFTKQGESPTGAAGSLSIRPIPISKSDRDGILSKFAVHTLAWPDLDEGLRPGQPQTTSLSIAALT